jgi:hypothetical protein
MSTLMDALIKRVAEGVRALYEHEHPGKQLEINLELLEIDILKQMAIHDAIRGDEE